MILLADPETREPLGPIMAEHEHMERLRVAAIRSAHWGGRPGFQTIEDRDADGMPVRLRFVGCADECPCWTVL